MDGKHIPDALDALRAMVAEYDETRSDTEGQWPTPNAGCIECTLGTVPDRLNRGLCGYHKACAIIAKAEGRC